MINSGFGVIAELLRRYVVVNKPELIILQASSLLQVFRLQFAKPVSLFFRLPMDPFWHVCLKSLNISGEQYELPAHSFTLHKISGRKITMLRHSWITLTYSLQGNQVAYTSANTVNRIYLCVFAQLIPILWNALSRNLVCLQESNAV